MEDYGPALARVIEQFLELLRSRKIADQDQEDLIAMMRALASVSGDPTVHLREHSQLMTMAYWYAHKYKIIAQAIQREADQRLGELYTGFRKSGYDDWTSKRMAESHTDYVQKVSGIDACTSISDMLQQLAKIAEQRLRILEQISNNFRSELRSTTV